MLRLNKHYNKNLQEGWNEYGEEKFDFKLIEKISYKECDKISEREQHYLNNAKKKYNISPYAGNIAGTPHTKKWKKKLSEMYSGEGNPLYGKHEENPMYGRKHTKKSIKKNSLSNGKLKEEEVIKIRKLLEEGNMLQKEIANKFNVSRPTISDINNEKRYKYI